MALGKLKTLHGRLFSIVLLAVVPVLLMALHMARDRYLEAKASALAASQNMAQSYSGEGRALFDRTKVLLAEVASLNAVQSLNGSDSAAVLAALGRAHPEFGEIILSRPDGGIVASSRPGGGQRPLSRQGWFGELLREKSFVVGGFMQGEGGRPACLPVALPVFGPDRTLRAVLSISLDLNALADLLDGMPLPQGAAATIIDRSGVILARYPADPQALGRPAPEAEGFLPGLLSDGHAVWESAGVDGAERIYFMDALLAQKGQGIFLRIGMPTEVAFAAARHGLTRSLLFIAGMTLLALFSTWLFSHAFVLRQVRRIWQATRRLSDGEYGHRIGPIGSGELGDLAVAFDSMAGVLESKTLRLVTQERKYRNIFEGSASGIFQTTPGGRIIEANPALSGMFGFSSPEEMIQSVKDIGGQLYAEPERREEIKRLLGRDGVVKDFEIPVKRIDGGRIWISLNVRAVPDKDGGTAYFEGMATDVTYRRMIEESLKAKQEKLQALMDHSHAQITIKDAKGRYLLVNRRFLEVQGFGSEVTGKGVEELFPPEDALRILQEDREVLEGGQPMTFKRPLTIKGVPHHFMVVKSPLFDESGRPDRVCSVAYDITDYEHVREALSQSEEKFRTMVQTSPDLIWMLDPQGVVVEANTASRELLGYDPEELRGMHLRQLFHPEDVQRHDRELVLPDYTGQRGKGKAPPGLINERRQQPRSTRDLSVRLIPKADGGQEPEPRHFELSSCGLWRDMAFLGTMVVVRDVTERLRAEEALRASQELLARTQAIGSIGGWTIDLDTRERKWTEQMYRLLGFSGENLPDFDGAAEFVHREDRPRYLDAVRRAEELGEGFDVELRLAGQGTSQRWVRFVGRRTDADGARVLTGSVQEITDRKNLELLRDDIDSIIRHDLKTPLNGIINLPQIIMSDPNLTSDQREYLRYIEEGGRKMLRQVEMSLDIMKIERGQFQHRPYPFDILRLVREAVGEMQEAAQRKKLSVEILLHGEPAADSGVFVVRAEERLCFPMLSNLIVNAIEASPEGARITVALDENAEHRVSIRNMGEVPAEIRERFFEKFITSGKFKGTGLGTYSASLFARAQGGSVELDSSEQGATTVSVLLPRTSAPGVV